METQQNKPAQVIAYLDKLSPLQLLQDEKVSEKFIELYNAIHGTKMGELIYHKEQFNFTKILSENPKLQQCTKLSIYGSFLDVAVMGLSLDQGSKPLAYITPKSIKVKQPDGSERWEDRASIAVSPYGELVMRMRAGHIKNADNPIIVYEGDTIKVGLNETGHRIVKAYDALIPRAKNAKIIGGFIRVERHGGAFENPWIDISDMDRLKSYSNKQNKGSDTDNKANALYTSNNGQIDPGFFEAKIIKHAFRSYPKIRIGEFTSLQTDEQEALPAINYNIDSETKAIQGNEPIQTPPVVNEDDNFEATTKGAVQTTVTLEEDETF